ncbi:MAG: hypothetical protein J5902_07605 [Paludibacteraceae bacterium]|nr:hypothetical protein [Paludibacteraceae bacterium]
MTKKQKRHIIATSGTVLFMLLVFLLLWFVYMRAVVPEEQEGIEIAFGEVEEAGGYMAEQSETVPMPEPVTAAPETSSAPSDNDLLTQEDEEALALRKEQEQKERERKAAEAAEKQRQREEQARLEAERKAREAAEAAERAKQAEAIAKANQFGSLFGNTGNNTGSGDSQGSGQKGNPVGHGSVGGNSWSLAGRGIKGSLPLPNNTFKQEGKVIVEIRVNAAGQVISATHKGGTVSDKQTIQLALDAARKAKFTEGDHDQIGTITYNFKFN